MKNINPAATSGRMVQDQLVLVVQGKKELGSTEEAIMAYFEV